MSSNTERFRRIQDLVTRAGAAPSRITEIGFGSMGEPVANLLVRHGTATRSPGVLRAIDGDVVQHRNIPASITYTEDDVGVPKVEAFQRHALTIDKRARIETWNTFLTENDIPRVTELARESDLLILAADDPPLMLKIADVCHDICPQLYAVMGARCDIAEVCWSAPSQTQPISRTLGQVRQQRIASPQALGVDTLWVASFVAALALRLLGVLKNDELLPCYRNAPMYAIGLRRRWLFQDMPPDSVRSVVLVGSEP